MWKRSLRPHRSSRWRSTPLLLLPQRGSQYVSYVDVDRRQSNPQHTPVGRSFVSLQHPTPALPIPLLEPRRCHFPPGPVLFCLFSLKRCAGVIPLAASWFFSPPLWTPSPPLGLIASLGSVLLRGTSTTREIPSSGSGPQTTRFLRLLSASARPELMEAAHPLHVAAQFGLS